jgi:hypothetical protein
MRTRTRQSIRDEIRSLADIEADPSVSDVELNRRIDAALAALWEIMADADASRMMRSTTLTTTSSTTSYLLSSATPPASDFLRMVHVDFIDGTEREPVEEHGRYNRRRTVGRETWAIVGQGLDGTQASIEFAPKPRTGTYQLSYIQAPQVIPDDDAPIDGVAGWEEYIVCRVARDVAQKREEVERYAWCDQQLQEFIASKRATARRTSGPHFPADAFGLFGR